MLCMQLFCRLLSRFKYSDHNHSTANLLYDPQVRFVMGEGTTLGDLLELQLHRVEDEVKNIVDKAVKEMGIEKVGSRELMLFE